MAGSAATGYSYISEFHTSSTAARAAAFVSISLSAIWLATSPLAIAIIPMDWILDLSILEYKPWRFYLTCASFINLWNAIVFSFLPETPKFLVAMNRKEKALDVLSFVYAVNSGQSKEVRDKIQRIQLWLRHIHFLHYGCVTSIH